MSPDFQDDNNVCPTCKAAIGEVHLRHCQWVGNVTRVSINLTPVSGIGDVTSTAKGSGARFNTDKPALDLIPLSIIASMWEGQLFQDEYQKGCIKALNHLGLFQTGGDHEDLFVAISALCQSEKAKLKLAWEECARVFDYGRKKYAAWNWAKGMPWSVCIGCAARHITAMFHGEDLDPESGLPHRGHVLCNLVMLISYTKTYTEGDDRPTFLFEEKK